jgi:RNA polymerase sigma factor (sigma-70 family)
MNAELTAEFTEQAAMFRRELLAFCYRMLGSAADAEEVVQETYLSAWRSYDTFEGRSSLRTWLYRIAARACLKALEGAKHRPRYGHRLPRRPATHDRRHASHPRHRERTAGLRLLRTRHRGRPPPARTARAHPHQSRHLRDRVVSGSRALRAVRPARPRSVWISSGFVQVSNSLLD